MAQKGLTTFFESFLEKKSLFLDKKALQNSYMPETIKHRDKEIEQVANVLAPSLKLDRPSNLFIYGKPGTGKTLSAKYVAKQITGIATQNNVNLEVLYLNCRLKRIADTEYRLIAQLIRQFGKEIPSTGLPTDEVYKIFFNTVDKDKKLIILILDEIDQLVKKTGDDILYNLTRINEDLKNSQISLIGISNDLLFADNLDPRVKSSLSEEEIVFPPYNALQIRDILKQRSKLAFRQEVLGQGVIEKCAAYSAREHGDARRALELLRVSGEIAERNNEIKIKISNIDEAEEKIEKDRVFDIIISQPKQQQAILYSILAIHSKKAKTLVTGEVYELYKSVCSQTDLRPLTQRRVSDIIGELDMLGIINVRVISKGRHGRTREIFLATPPSSLPKIKKTLAEGLDLA